MTTVACVLRSGGDFDESWVRRLQALVAKHLPQPHRFVCLADVEVAGVEVVPLQNDWPRWWPKLALFQAGLFDGPVLYLDLDTLPVGDLSELAGYRGHFAMLTDFYTPSLAASGVMAWTPDRDSAAIYERFTADADAIMAAHPSRMDRWLSQMVRKPQRLQELYPRQIVSLKAHASKVVPEGARLVAGHGKPRFSSPKAGWAHEVWRDAA